MGQGGQGGMYVTYTIGEEEHAISSLLSSGDSEHSFEIVAQSSEATIFCRLNVL